MTDVTLADTFSWSGFTNPLPADTDGFVVEVDGVEKYKGLAEWNSTESRYYLAFSALGGLTSGTHTLNVRPYNVRGNGPLAVAVNFTLTDSFLLNEPTDGGEYWDDLLLRSEFDASTVRTLDTRTFAALQALCLQERTIVDFEVNAYIDLEGNTLEIASSVFLMGSSAGTGGVTLYNGRVVTRTDTGWSDNIFFSHVRVDLGSIAQAGETADKQLTTARADRVYLSEHFSASFARRMLDGIAIECGNSRNVVIQNCDVRNFSRAGIRVRDGQLAVLDSVIGPCLNVPVAARRFLLHGVEHGNNSDEDKGASGIVAVGRTDDSRLYVKRTLIVNAGTHAIDIRNRHRSLCVNPASSNTQWPWPIDSAGHEIQVAYIGHASTRGGGFRDHFPVRLAIAPLFNKTRIYADPNGTRAGVVYGANVLFDAFSDSNELGGPGAGYADWQKAANPWDAVNVPTADIGTWFTPGDFYTQGQSRIGAFPKARDQLSADLIAYWVSQQGIQYKAPEVWLHFEQDCAAAVSRPFWVSASGYETTGDLLGRPTIAETSVQDHSAVVAMDAVARFAHYSAQVGALKDDYAYTGDYAEAFVNNAPDIADLDLSNLDTAEFVTLTKTRNPREGERRSVGALESPPDYTADIVLTVQKNASNLLLINPADTGQVRSADNVTRILCSHVVGGVETLLFDSQTAFWWSPLEVYNQEVLQPVKALPVFPDTSGLDAGTYWLSFKLEINGVLRDDAQSNRIQYTVESA